MDRSGKGDALPRGRQKIELELGEAIRSFR